MAGISKAERERRKAEGATLTPPVTGKRQQEGQRMLDPWTGESNAYLHALCAALPFSGVAKAWEPLTFEMRLEAAKVNAEAILRAVAERNQAPTFLDGIAELQDLIKEGERGGK